jgi:hypothetical protein
MHAKKPNKQQSKARRFANEDEEAKWWASREGRAFLKKQSRAGAAGKVRSRLIANLNRSI